MIKILFISIHRVLSLTLKNQIKYEQQNILLLLFYH